MDIPRGQFFFTPPPPPPPQLSTWYMDGPFEKFEILRTVRIIGIRTFCFCSIAIFQTMAGLDSLVPLRRKSESGFKGSYKLSLVPETYFFPHIKENSGGDIVQDPQFPFRKRTIG